MGSTTEVICSQRQRKRISLAGWEAIQGYMYITPWVVGFLAFTLGPMLASLYLSLTTYRMVRAPVFVGLTNYLNLFKDPLTWKSLENTVYYAGIFVPVGIATARSTIHEPAGTSQRSVPSASTCPERSTTASGQVTSSTRSGSAGVGHV